MISTLTINPAIDRILYVDTLHRGETTRVYDHLETMGGKGTHVSINLSIMGLPSAAFGVVHGYTGGKIMQMLQSHEHINSQFLCTNEGNTRTNYLLVEKSGMSSLISEKGPLLQPQTIDLLLQSLVQNIPHSSALVIAGDASNCSDTNIYSRVVQALRHLDLRVYIDASDAYIRACLQEGIFLMKPNLSELSTLCGRPVQDNAEDTLKAIRELDDYAIPIIAASLGSRGSVVKYHDRFFVAQPPLIAASNTVGCGDCFFAGLIFGLEMHLPFPETLAYATAASAATAMHPLSVGFDPALAKKLQSQVHIQEIR